MNNNLGKILVTGGLGYIGSHTIVELLDNDYEVVALDNLSNSDLSVLERIKLITNKSVPFYQTDLRDKEKLRQLFLEHKIDAVIHFAGLKSVGESVSDPTRYYQTNLESTLTLIDAMKEHEVKNIVFSSSATVYGDPEELPLKETSRIGVGITNPYGWTKYMLEQILKDLHASDSSWSITILRYFNPVGAHSSGKIGEQPTGIPNNLLPYVQQVASGQRQYLNVYGNDYDTPDGTGVRDYIHVVDLSKGHLAALAKLSGLNIFNLGTGSGVSVLEIVSAFEQATGQKIKYKIAPRRQGDIAACYADASKAARELNWRAEKSIEDACKDAWNWQQYSDSL